MTLPFAFNQENSGNQLLLSIVVPVYLSSGSLDELCWRLKESLSSISENYEIILVNDHSPDNSWEKISGIAKEDSRVRGISLSRNFGQHYAITAGLDFCRGKWVVVMDCDLQDMPEEIPKLFEKAQEGFEVVVGRRVERKDSFFKKMFSAIFYEVFAYFTGARVDKKIGNFSAGNTSQPVGNSHCISAVDGGGIDHFFGRHFIFNTSERRDKIHIPAGR